MTKEEIRKLLDNTKVYVNGKSMEIQEKLFSFGYDWSPVNHSVVKHLKEPFLFTDKNGNIVYGNDMDFFKKHDNREISAEEILSLEITGPSYRPFESQAECFEEMKKHIPFGWLKSKQNESFLCIGKVFASQENKNVYIIFSTNESLLHRCGLVFENYTFADGTPFGILEN